eukprot:TRINITY_DN114619_c0_g1_i1.p1 TRINITY_DN114619_c0_g1~~TRINITY_DN114619_c0_g1_i1.p1  ORF type:complete len:216 (+),score=27.18 TRINITY_DN114619_c0_g1_i1:59-706(+)
MSMSSLSKQLRGQSGPMVRSLLLLVLALACPLCTVAIRSAHRGVAIGEALEVNESATGGCSAEQCKTCCCSVTALKYSDADPNDLSFYETLVATAKPGYRDEPTCRGSFGSKFDTLGACGKQGCKACSESTLAACEKPADAADTCCRFTRPPDGYWHLALVPWYEMRGKKSCSDHTGAPIADTAKMECCKRNKVNPGYAAEFESTYAGDPSWCQG